MSGTVASGDRVLLWQPDGDRRFLVVADGTGARKVPGLGIHDPDKLVGTAWGARADIAGRDILVLRPTANDLGATIKRQAQIITRKDLGPLLHHLAIGAGDRVFECGAGSGAATTALAAAVGESGAVVVQELREDFRDHAAANLTRAGLVERVGWHLGDVRDGLADGVEGPFDATLLDLPCPEAGIQAVAPQLRPGARVACYCVQLEQAQKAAEAMQQVGIEARRTLEIIERAWHVEGRSRPATEGLGHTAFLVLGRMAAQPASASP